MISAGLRPRTAGLHAYAGDDNERRAGDDVLPDANILVG